MSYLLSHGAPAGLIEIRAEGTEQQLDENRVEQVHVRIANSRKNGMHQKSIEGLGLTAFRVLCLVSCIVQKKIRPWPCFQTSKACLLLTRESLDAASCGEQVLFGKPG